MVTVNYWSHIPHVRLQDEVADFGPGKLWRVPFEIWDHLMLGAFSDHRDAYEATAPVCFYVETDVDWDMLRTVDPATLGHVSNIEAKKPTFSADDTFERAGLGFMTSFTSELATTAQAALSLAIPTAGPGSPRMSVTMFKPDDAVIDFGDQEGTGARLQGDADHEWLLMPEAAGDPLEPVDVANGSVLYDVAWEFRRHDDLRPAIDALLLAAQPTLDHRQRLTLCTIAIEALLMPEARSDLAATFRRRVATLLSHLPDAEAAAGMLYRARSAALHGDAAPESGAYDDHARRCVAQTVLAASIVALGPTLAAGTDIDDVRAALDDGTEPDDAIRVPSHDLSAEPGRAGWARLERDAPTSTVAVITVGGTLHTPDATHAAWCPLIGLRSDDTVAVASDAAVGPLEGADLMELEERDIRRDFMAQIAADPTGMPRQGLLMLPGEGPPDLADLRRRRRDAVLALRIAGFGGFVDPALLGWFVFEGSIRTRIPSVLRQSVIRQAAHDAPETVTTSDGERLVEQSATIQLARQRCPDPEVEALLDSFLVAHPTSFFPGEASAALLLAGIETVFGRFRPRSAPVQLEHLVDAVAAPDDAEWFRSNGRAFRNDLAHGRWVASTEPGAVDEPLVHLLAIDRAILSALLRFGATTHDPASGPLIDAYATQVEAALA